MRFRVKESSLKKSSKLKVLFRSNKRTSFLLIIVIILIIVFSLINPIFLELESIMNMVRDIAIVSIISIGMSLVILIGGLDLSVGSSLALSGAIAALTINKTGSALLAIIVAIVIPSIIGFINGLIIGRAKINAVILTLAMLGICRSLTLVLLNAQTLRVKNYLFNFLGAESINVGKANIPYSLFLIIFLFLLFYFILNRSTFGRRLKAIGGNFSAAKVFGISTENNILLTYIIVGILVGIGSILMVGRNLSAAPLAGVGLEFGSITVVILGGASLNGGKLDLKGTFLGVILLAILISGLSFSNVLVYYIDIVKGILLMISIAINSTIERYQAEY